MQGGAPTEGRPYKLVFPAIIHDTMKARIVKILKFIPIALVLTIAITAVPYLQLWTNHGRH